MGLDNIKNEIGELEQKLLNIHAILHPATARADRKVIADDKGH